MKHSRTFSLAALVTLLCCLVPARAQQTLTVYDGTSTTQYVPAYIYYWDDFTRSQFVIPSSDLTAMNGGTISALTFYTTSQNVPYASTSTCDVYLKEVNSTTLSYFVSKSSVTVVYSGTVSIVTAGDGGTMTITFSTPYTYHGGNLLIGIENTTDSGYKNIYFYGQTVTGASGAGYNSSRLSGVTFTQRDIIPKTTFTYTAGTPATPDWNFNDTMAYCGTNPTFGSGILGMSYYDAVAVKYPASMMAGRNHLRSVFIKYPI